VLPRTQGGTTTSESVEIASPSAMALAMALDVLAAVCGRGQMRHHQSNRLGQIHLWYGQIQDRLYEGFHGAFKC